METVEIIGYIAALLIGIILGLLGGGGSILTVPLLVYIMGYNPVVATAYSLFVVGTSSIAGVAQKLRMGLVDLKTGFSFVFPSFIAVYLSRRYLVPALPETFFKIGDFEFTQSMGLMLFFAFVMLYSAFAMIRSKNSEESATKIPYYQIFIQGIAIGFITGMIGAGGGFLYVPALVLWSGLPMKKAVGTSLVIIAVNSLIGFSGDVQNLDIEWVFLLIFSLLTLIGVLIGGKLSKYVPNKKLKRSFGYFILIMSFYIIYKELL
ncbi:sulfite exporter TauE/SafE family protein [Spongiivirga sp. MCCC 1A20706]|uniref:sulfite exporter TauE/SafE family protein n=1 Tax=Spongiivirga sp. MCCC 1A20706 TaxID=3160963 RepID=UPI00397726E1